MAARVLLAGHLLQAKGDRVSMHSSVEVRYPFLDEDVFDFTANFTRAGSSGVSETNICCACLRNAGFRNRSRADTKSSFARRSTAFTWTRNRPMSRNS